MVRKVETFPPVTMGHIRGHGCRDFAVDQNAFQRAMALGKGWRPFFFAVRPLARMFRAGLPRMCLRARAIGQLTVLHAGLCML